jgi:predicted methyltransferase
MERGERESLVNRQQRFLAGLLREGDWVVDATVGNGHDTLFLARQVGRSGRVYGFDIQQAALDATVTRLRDGGGEAQVRLFKAGHEGMAEHLPQETRGRIKAVLFNLGYLPGSDKQTVTRPATTITALEGVLQWLAPGGVISVLAYTGHPGGRDEAERVKRWVAGLSPAWEVIIDIPPSRNNNAPEWVLIRSPNGPRNKGRGKRIKEKPSN